MGSKVVMRLGEAAWWWVVLVSIPFSFYSIPFVMGVFDLYKHLTLAALDARYDIAGLHILRHVFTWQVHSTAGLAFMLTAPFQFHMGFRNRNPKVHHIMGYVFVVASVILGTTGSTIMSINSEFHLLGKVFMSCSGLLQLFSVAKAVIAARRKDIPRHRMWMTRAATLGYVVIDARIVLVILQKIFHIPALELGDYSMIVSWIINVCCVETYFQVQSRNKAKISKN